MIKISAIAMLTILLILAGCQDAEKQKRNEEIANCLTEKGVTFYGAFWCPHCQNQKKMFGEAEKLLPYVECSTPDGRGQLQVCKDKNIEGYPTWELSDGSRVSGEIEPEELARIERC